MPVGVVEGVGRLPRDPKRLVHRELLLAPEPIAKRLALDEGHAEPEQLGPPGLEQGPAVVHCQDVGVLEPGAELDLAEEAVGAQGSREVGMENLEGHGAVVAEVLGQVDGGHAAPTELALDAVATSQGVTQSARQIGHGAPGCGCAFGRMIK